VSGDQTGNEYDLHAVMNGEADGGVPHGAILSAFAEGICRRDEAKTNEARVAIVAAMGEAAMVDAAAVIAAFNAYPRAADATGIPLEDMKVDMTADIRADLGLEAFNVGK
jgi:F0F1-type ATP synthase membrane subunit c/vacuolar-type H+-ATPase subunit K